MSRDWKPGDVAMVAASNRTEPYRAYYDGKTWREYDADMFCVDVPTSVRPLVVIDPEDREQVERFQRRQWRVFGNERAMTEGDYGWILDRVQVALREFADPKPPKPEEPTGLGAVVEDADGKQWVRIFTHGSCNDWREAEESRPGNAEHTYRRYWHEIDAVRVLSTGVDRP